MVEINWLLFYTQVNFKYNLRQCIGWQIGSVYRRWSQVQFFFLKLISLNDFAHWITFLLTQFVTYLVARISKLIKNAKWIFRANVTNSFQACFSVPDIDMPLSFGIQNAYNRSFKMKYCDSLYSWNFLRKLNKSTKK